MKSLIFVYPLTESLKSYYDLICVNAAQEGIEIYEIDDINEFNQLFQSLGASIALFGDPRKCLKCLVANKKYTSALGSKILLFSNQLLNNQTLTKFHDLGLTEFLVEPIATKSTSYKINLLLKSLPQKTENKEQEEVKTFKKQEEEKNQKEPVSTVKSMMILEDPKEKNYNVKKEKKINLNIESDGEDHSQQDIKTRIETPITDDNKQNPHKANNISSYWRSRDKKEEINLFGETEEIEKQKKEPKKAENHKTKGIRGTDLDLEAGDEDINDNHNKSGIKTFYKNRISQESPDLEIENEAPKKATLKPSHSLTIKKDKKTKSHLDETIEINYAKNQNALEISPDEEESQKKKNQEQDQRDIKKISTTSSLLVESEDEEAEEEDLNYLEDELFKKAKQEIELQVDEHQQGPSDSIEQLTSKTKDNQREIEISLTKSSSQSRFHEDEIEKYIKSSLKHKKGFTLDECVENNALDDIDIFCEEDFEQDENKATELVFEQEKIERPEDQEQDPLQDDDTNNPKTVSLDLERSKAHKQDHDDITQDQSPIHLADNRADKVEKYYKGIGNSHKKQDWRVIQRVRTKTIKLNLLQDDDCSLIKASDLDAEVAPSSHIEQMRTETSNTLYKDSDYSAQNSRKERSKDQIELDYLQKRFKKDEQILSSEKQVKKEQDLSFDLLEKKKDILASQRVTIDNLSFDESKFEEQNEENQDTRPLIIAQPCAMIELIKISQTFIDQTTSLKEHMQNVAHTIDHHLGGQTCFYVLNQNTGEHEKFLCYPEIKAQKEEIPESLSSWSSLESIKYPFWKLMNLPVWSDHTFQDTEIDYFHPFFEEGIHLGFAICYFQHGLQATRCHEVEVLIESARALYLELAEKTLSLGTSSSPKGANKDAKLSQAATFNEEAANTTTKRGILGRLLGS